MLVRRIPLVLVALLTWIGFPDRGHTASPVRQDSSILAAAPGEPIEVRVGIQVQQIEFVNQKAENFGVVGTLRLQWDDPHLAFDAKKFGEDFMAFDRDGFREYAHENSLFFPGFIIQNQQDRRFTQYSLFVIWSDGRASYYEQFSTVLQAPDFNFVALPFDTQTFFVHLVSAHPAKFVRYVPSKSFSELGKQLGEEEWVFTESWTEVAMHEGITGLQSSRFSFGFTARRNTGYYVLRIFTPLLIFVFVSWATFFLEEYRKRIDIAGANLLTFAAFNFAISSDLPRLGYMTFLDFILMAMFVVNGLIIVFNVGLRRLRIKERDDLARTIDAYALKWAYPLVYVAIVSWAVYKFLYQPFLPPTG